MAKKRSAFSTLVVLAVLFAGVWLYFTPYLALNRLQKAARDGDTRTMNELVDFPALRESVKQNVRTAVEGRGHSPFGFLGGILAGAVAGPLVDAFVTPQGIAALTEGRRPGHHSADVDSAAAGLHVKNVQTRRGYEGVDLFVVHFVDRNSGHEKMALLMHRDGLAHWRLTGIRLPDGGSGDTK